MDQLTQNLRAAVGREAVLADREELLVYECDGLTQHRQRPRAVVFPHSTEEVAEVLSILKRERVPFAPRGAGTGLSGGALSKSVVVELARMRRLIKLDTENRRAIVETGFINAQLSRAAAPFQLHYVPDPSSQMTCTIGGNIAENAGGIHCLKYGMTVDHVTRARVVLAGGEIVDLRAGGAEAPGYDLLGLFIGSEGTFGIATEATLRLTPLPPAVRTLLADFTDVSDGSRAVSAIIAAGLVPSALEMMDGVTIRAVERSVFAAGLPAEAEAALLIELDGLEAGIDEEAARAESICREHRARHVRLARDERERQRFWAARKGAFGAMGRLAPDLMLQDTVVPRSRLPEVLAEIYRIGAKYELLVANVFHAGDGNLHPYICFDSRRPDEVRRVKEAGREMMETCVRAGGTITGEHGVGLDKSEYLPLIFSPDDMDAMLRVRAAFDPDGLCNPGKIIPTARSCGEARAALKRNDGHAEAESAAAREAERVEMKAAEREDEEAESEEAHKAVRVRADDVQSVSASMPQASSLHQASLPQASPPPERQSPALQVRRSFNIEKAREALARIVGAEHVSAGTRARGSSAPALDTSPPSASPSISVAPETAEEACEVVRLSALEGWAVVPAGAGTWLDAGQPLRRADVILQTSRMRRILEHEPADLVASAEAGVGLAQFNDELRRAGQWLPLDPPGCAGASLGGVAATGMAGAQSFGYGAPRAFVIGMRVALADGRIRKAGGRVVKNVAGYDLCKLFVGSHGTLGLILDLTFKLRPRPAQEATVLATGSLPALWRGARELLTARLFPVAVELLSAQAAAACGVPLADESGCALLMRFAGAGATVAFQLERARALLDRQQDIRRTSVSLDDETLWQQLAALTVRQDNPLVWHAHVPAAELGAILASASHADSRLFPPGSCWHASAGDGRLRMISPLQNEAGEDVRWLLSWRALVERSGGWLIIESAPREYKEACQALNNSGAEAALMQRIKQQLDEADTFSPGRFDTST